MKTHYPTQFWSATLRHCHSSYRKWVHIYEAKLADVEIDTNSNKSIYTKHRHTRLKNTDIKERVKSLGIWSDSNEFYPDCFMTMNPDPEKSIHISGLIAYSRTLVYRKTKTVLVLVGYAPKQYIELKISAKYIPIHSAIGITCNAAKKCVDGSLESETFTFW
jgi:hypothetical protein